jgi:glycine dehydrogenase subunit 1
MFRYVSLTKDEKLRMLKAMGRRSVEELFDSIPSDVRLKGDLSIPGPLSETEVLRYFKQLASQNLNSEEQSYFLGAGAYHHFVPVIIDSLISRAEFLTAYTPYQPEISQGTLQSIFEFQTMICQLTGMDVSNASLYDGSTALAEALLMAERTLKRRSFAISNLIHPQYRAVMETYTRSMDFRITSVPHTREGLTDLDAAQQALSGESAALAVQYPNFFGNVEDLQRAADVAHRHKAMLIVVVTEPIALGLLRPPGDFSADICLGEGQGLGIPLSYGGPYLGFFAARDEFKRQMPGRIVGETVDSAGERGFVLTLATREQHIRREKATSNICTNEGLIALMANIFMSTLGKTGMRELAMQNFSKARYTARRLQESGVPLAFGNRFFNEFVVRTPRPVVEINERLAREGIIGGYDLSSDYAGMENHMLVCVTEQNTRRQIDRFVELMAH